MKFHEIDNTRPFEGCLVFQYRRTQAGAELPLSSMAIVDVEQIYDFKNNLLPVCDINFAQRIKSITSHKVDIDSCIQAVTQMKTNLSTKNNETICNK